MNDHTMDRMVALLGAFFAWFLSQPTSIQVIVAVGILAALYPLLVIVRVITIAAYGAFRGLG
jgi:uncharacterized protein (DUF2062 family)